MTKWIKRIVIGLIVLVVVFFIGLNWLIKEVFGPKYRTVKINLDNQQTLIGRETYNADFAAVFYDVEFTLETKNKGTYQLGRGTFTNEHWNKTIRLYHIANWFVLPVDDGPYAKILLANKTNRANKDTIFSPKNLRYDQVWKRHYAEIPARVYTGSSMVDIVDKNKLFITYIYRIGDYPTFKVYTQTFEYRFDTLKAEFETKRIFERNERKAGV